MAWHPSNPRFYFFHRALAAARAISERLSGVTVGRDFRTLRVCISGETSALKLAEEAPSLAECPSASDFAISHFAETEV